MSQVLPPLSLYVHLPWCVKKCPYCDFNSHTGQEIPEAAYLAQLKQDLLADKVYAEGRALRSIFFGGGTPSLMSTGFYQDLLQFVRQHLKIKPDTEITLEANPGTTEAAKFAGYREAGINRLSLGVQSFQPAYLEKLGRIHSGADAIRAVEQAQQAGFDNFNLDLMHGLPGQDVSAALADLQQAIELAPTHLSWYQLTIEQNTEFYRHPPVLPEDEALWEIQQAGVSLLQDAGFFQYEVSAYARPGRQAQHNLNYWEFGDYLGIGAGAHGKVTQIIDDQLRIQRYRKTRLPKDYLNASYNLQPQPSLRIGEEIIVPQDLPFEFMMNALRLTSGVPERLFQQRTSLSLSGIAPVLAKLRKQGLMQEAKLATTEKGLLFLNDVLAEFAEIGTEFERLGSDPLRGKG
jgi:oxygen-independent coproporphyrinogen-3 oxidase